MNGEEAPPLLQGMGNDDDDVYSPPPTSATSSSGASSQDEGWAEDGNEGDDAILLPPRPTTINATSAPASRFTASHSTGLACRILRLELPTMDDMGSFLGLEKEELIVTCQIRGGESGEGPIAGADEATDVASTRLPTSYRPSKRQVCWDQRLDLIGEGVTGGGQASSSAWRANPDTTLHFMLWSSSTLLGQADFLLKDGVEMAGSLQRVVLVFAHGTRRSAVLGRRESCGAGIASRHHDVPSLIQPSSCRRPSPEPLWRRTVSEPSPVRTEEVSPANAVQISPLSSPSSSSTAAPSMSLQSSSFAWPEHATLVFELLFPSLSSSSSISSLYTPTIAAPPASTPTTEPTIWQHLQLILARPSDGVSLEEARLLWLHRHGIVLESSRALVKLLRALMVSNDLRHDILAQQQQQRQQQPQQQQHDSFNNHNDDTVPAPTCPVVDVLRIWRDGRESLPILDAMKLLGGHFPHPSIRALALETLSGSSDEELGLFLLQLVQLLRYEPTTTTGEVAAAAAAAAAAERPSLLPPPSPMSSSSTTTHTHTLPIPINTTPLAKLLIERACCNLELANALFWYTATEMHHDRLRLHNGRGFEAVRFAFLYALHEANEPVYFALCAQETWFKKVARIHQRVIESSGLRERKQAMLRNLLLQEGVSAAPFPVPLPIDTSLLVTHLDAATACVYGSTTYPAFITFESSSSSLLSSLSSAPSSLSSSLSAIPHEATEEQQEQEEKRREQQQQQQQQQTSPSGQQQQLHLLQDLGNTTATVPTPSSSSNQGSSSNSTNTTSIKTRKVLIFKCREDLRQDQLILQLIGLMDTLLKQDLGLDLCLTPYRVLATGTQEGLVEYVPGARTIADILASPSAALSAMSSANSSNTNSNSNSSNSTSSSSKILAFFREHHPWRGPTSQDEKEEEEEDEEGEGGLGVDPGVLDTYIRSCAGYCVMTHLLGIGDRHLHNIMLCPDGRFFHLDFGFILGKDPKPTPLLGPFRLSASMVEGMGGKEHRNFVRFKQLCVAAFNGLRKHASFVVGVVGLMVDAGLKDLGGGGGGGGGSSSSNGGAGGGMTTSIGGSVGGSSSGGALRGGSLSLSGTTIMATASTSTTGAGAGASGAASTLTMAPPPPPHNLEAARILSKMEGRFRLDLTDEEAEKHFVGLIHKALGALAPQVIEVLHNLAVKTK